MTLWIKIDTADTVTRNRATNALGAILTLGGGALAAWLWTLGSWWIAGAIPCILVALIGVVGFFADLQKKDRTD
ncbi:hypothetical protein FHX37_0478 [Haloactinospora alba]|uniref:Uncharacterized protein n=1 Tax=Haloactinospora alba TaxID=405555 RepID=A0A543NFK8_9ACTN|nr:hypothetical protein [Haloactinospora alba]TQN30596.1 hypothetical protein FHX37_0478 [Haloactinospora alba]